MQCILSLLPLTVIEEKGRDPNSLGKLGKIYYVHIQYLNY